MKLLERVVLIQFFLCDQATIEIGGNVAFTGPNGTGKTAVADAIQIALLGAHGTYVKVNAQADREGHAPRSIQGYCLGQIDNKFRREHAQTYISLVFRDEKTGVEDSAGVCLSASRGQPTHEVEGMYVVRGLGLNAEHHIEHMKHGDVPLRWKDFQQELKQRAKDARAEVMFFSRPEQYISELIMAVGGGERINQKDFLKAFRKSITLHNIHTVDGFVRDFLVDARSVDKARALEQINQFKKLSLLVQTVKQHIEELGGLGKEFDRMHAHQRRAVAYEAAAISLRHEETAERVDFLTEKSAELENGLSSATLRETALKDEIARIEAELATADSDLAKSDEMQAKRHQQGVLEGYRRENATLRDAVLRPLIMVELAAEALAGVTLTGAMAQAVQQIRNSAGEARKALGKGEFDAAETAAKRALQNVSELMVGVERMVEDARAANDAAKARLREIEGAIKVADQFGVRLNPDANEALQMLEDAGIKAVPVCTKLRVTERKWQTVVESFLASNRDALMVPRGKENEAVDLLLGRTRRLHNAAIVQPDHFRSDIGRKPEQDQVSSVIEGDDPTALAFARQIFGSMQKAYTADDLRRMRNALTPEGGLSRSGSTKTIRMESPENFKLGRKFEPGEAASLKRERDIAAQQALSVLKVFEEKVAIRDRVAAAQNTKDLERELGHAMNTLRSSSAAIARQEERIAAIAVGKYGKLEEAAAQLRTKRNERVEARVANSGVRAGFEKDLTQARAALKTCESDFAELRKLEEAKRADPDYSAQQADECRQELEKTKGTEIAVLVAEAHKRAATARTSFNNLKDTTLDRFRHFIDVNNYGLMEERTDWRRAMAWTHDERVKLEESKLVEYQEAAERARQVAEESFRNDVATSIANAIGEMRAVIRELNRTLDLCPEFTRSERFRFDATVRPQFKAIHDYIVHSSSPDLLSGNDNGDASKQIVELLEQSVSATPSKEPNPLDDFRLMFSFDVDISVNGVHQNWLSKRLGPGSGGEHKTPFYVIAGAALAHAYRLDSKSGKRGAAVMILDEAFDKINAQNTHAAARFLQNLGLQLIMTAPDSANSILMPVTDRIYDMTRHDMDLFYSPNVVKEKARELMRSDMTSEHPELLTNKIEELRAE